MYNEKLNGRRVAKNKYASNYAVNVPNGLPNLIEESNENIIEQNPFTIVSNKDPL